MSETASVLALIVPAAFAVLTAWFAGRNGFRSSPVAIATIGIVALVAGFFVTFTVAWSISSSALLVSLTSVAVGVLVGMLGHLVTRERVNG